MEKTPIYFIYDGECPICTLASQMFKIREISSELHVINARESDNPYVKQVTQKGYDLDAGMVIIYQEQFFHGADAVHLMALIGSSTGWFNKINSLIFKSKPLTLALYPFLKGARNLALFLKRKPQIKNLNHV